MSNVTTATEHSAGSYTSYIVGFVLSIFATLAAYFLVVNHVFDMQMLVYSVIVIAVVQLVVQVIFFLHVGARSGWRLATLLFAVLIVLVIVIGSLWIMQNLDYNMMHMSPEEMQIYMKQNEGI